MMNVSMNKRAAGLNIISTENAILTRAIVHASACTRIRPCVSKLTTTMGGVVDRTSIRNGMENVKMNTPGTGCCAKAIRGTIGVP